MPATPHFPARRLLAFVAAFAVLLAGCVTDDQVRSIVRDSNYEMLLASTPGLDTTLSPNPEAGANPTDLDAAARTTAFLAAHADDPAMASALRLRQTLLHLAQRSFALAEATRQQIVPDALHSARDKALAAALDDLTWWAKFSLAGELEFSSNHADEALQHMESLRTRATAKNLPTSPDLRDYFMEMSAWIGIKLGLATAGNPALKKERVQQAVDAWAAGFTEQELALLNSDDFKNVKPFDLTTRRVLRLRAMLTTLAAKDRGLGFSFSRTAVNQFYARLPHP